MNSKMPHLTVTLFQTQPSLWLQSPQPQKSTADVAPLHGLQHQDLHHKQERETRHTHKKKLLRNKLVERILTDFVLSASCLFVSRMECRLSTIPVNLCICQPHSTCHNSLSLSFFPLKMKKATNILICLPCCHSKRVSDSGILLAEEVVRLLPLGAAAALACSRLRPRRHKQRWCLGRTVLPPNVLAQHVLLALSVFAVQ